MLKSIKLFSIQLIIQLSQHLLLGFLISQYLPVMLLGKEHRRAQDITENGSKCASIHPPRVLLL